MTMNETIKQEQDLLGAILDTPEPEKEEKAPAEEVVEAKEEIEPTDEATVEDDPSVEDDTSDKVNEEDDLEDVDEEDFEEDDDEEDDLDESDEDQTEDDLITVVVDGEEQEVTLEELKSSFSGNAYMQKQVQEAVEDRKAAQTELANAGQAAHEYYAKLQQLEEILNSQIPQEPDWEKLKAENPELYNRQLAEWNDLNRKQAAIQEAKEAEQKQMQQRDLEQKEKYGRQQAQLALQKMPHLSDQEVAAETGQKWGSLVREYDFTDQEFALVTDHRLLHILDDFVRTREELAEIKSKRKKARDMKGKDKRRVKRSVRPNAATAQSRKDEKQRRIEARNQRARQTGKVEDVAATLIVDG